MLNQKCELEKHTTSCFEIYKLLSDGSVDINSIPKDVISHQKFPYYDYLTRGEKFLYKVIIKSLFILTIFDFIFTTNKVKQM